MRVAVCTLTRDRLEYTKHCFKALRKHAGCDFDHFVHDNGSTDGTPDWLRKRYHPFVQVTMNSNYGISLSMNYLLDVMAEDFEPYDVVVKLDNDCELTEPNTLRAVCELVMEGNAILSPRILGLNNPPAFTDEFRIGESVILDVPQIGGIFLAVPGWVYDEFRYSESNPPWGMDDVEICRWFRAQGGRCGYVNRLGAWHYQTTSAQHERFPDYFARTLAEGKPSL